jgi:hypothetical protein
MIQYGLRTYHNIEILLLLRCVRDQACSSGRCRTVGGSTGVGFNSLCLPWVFTTVVLTIVTFPTHPPYGWLQVWKPHFPIGSKYGVLAPRSAIKIQKSGTSRRWILWLSVRLLGIRYNWFCTSAIKINEKCYYYYDVYCPTRRP